MASLTVATKMAPMEGYRRREPPSTLIQRPSRAPELSAMRRRLSCWTTSAPLSRPLEHLLDPPTLQLGQGAGLGEAYTVADPHVVGFVMGVQALRALHGLGITGMAYPL